MERKESKNIVWHPELQTYYRKKLTFITVTAQPYRAEFKRALRPKFPTLDIYEVYGPVDLILRIYSTEDTLNALKRHLSSELQNWGSYSCFTVDRIHRIWGKEVGTLSVPDLSKFDPHTLKQIVAKYPDLPDEFKIHNLILGRRRKSVSNEIRAFATIWLQNTSEVENFVGKIRRSKHFERPVIGIYEGTGLEGSSILLEIAVRNFQNLQPLKEKLYEISPFYIKTSTFLVGDINEVGDTTDFSESDDMLINIYSEKFPILRLMPFEKRVAKILYISPLRTCWKLQVPIDKCSHKISEAIVSEDSVALRGSIVEISHRLEKALRATLFPYLEQEFGTEEWRERSRETLKLHRPLGRKSQLGELILAANQLRDKVTLPVSPSILHQFLPIRNYLVHDDEDTSEASSQLNFEGLQQKFKLPDVVARLFTQKNDLFSR